MHTQVMKPLQMTPDQWTCDLKIATFTDFDFVAAGAFVFLKCILSG